MQCIAAASANYIYKLVITIKNSYFFSEKNLRSVVNSKFGESANCNNPALNAQSRMIAFALSEKSAGTNSQNLELEQIFLIVFNHQL